MVFAFQQGGFEEGARPNAAAYDLFATADGTFIDLTRQGFGVLPLRGKPMGPGDTDTIVVRKEWYGQPPIGETISVDIELEQVSLESVEPVEIDGVMFNVELAAGKRADPENPSPDGTLITRTSETGGTYSSELPVVGELKFTEVGNPDNTFNVPFENNFQSPGEGDEPPVWSNRPGPMPPDDPALPDGGFFPGVDPLTFLKIPAFEIDAFARHGVVPAMDPSAAQGVPEPSGVVLAGLGILALLQMRRRRPAKL